MATEVDLAQLPVSEVLAELQATPDGLTGEQVRARRERFGANAIEERRRSALAELLSFFWGPIPWMIEVADLLSGILRHWVDVVVISVLLVVNAAVGFWQEHTAADVVATLKRQLALRARVLRDGRWHDADAAELVPGDVVRIRLGDIVPADVKLLEGSYLQIDQSAMTGESLPVEKQRGDPAFSGSVAIQGDMTGIVTYTGSRTYFGRTTRLVAAATPGSHFQKAVLTIGDYLIWLSLTLVSLLVVVELFRGVRVFTLIQFALILAVAAVPVAMPAVLSVTMAVGAVALSRMRAIVTHLESIEEMAGIDVLCSDKTGTLTENRLTLGDPVVIEASGPADVILAGALASQPETGDTIDRAVVSGVTDPSDLESYHQAGFVPFDPVSKRSTAEVTGADGTFTVTKGAPQVVLDLCEPDPATATRAMTAVQRLAVSGRRALGVARRGDEGRWRFLGLLPLADPPRSDSAETIHRATEFGITVKMLTGDSTAIANEVAERVGLHGLILPARELLSRDAGQQLSDDDLERIESCGGFAEVFPEHKYAIVKALQASNHIVGMTGDGVNDAPALRQADTGVAVAGATDAARSASDLVLTAPGLATIVSAIEQARVIFERMNSYAIYRVTETIRIILFVVVTILAFNFYPITAILIILLALFNDLPIMTISVDNASSDPEPVRWDMRQVLSVSTVLGLVGVVETFLMLVLAERWLHLGIADLQSLVFLKLAVAGHLTLFVARSRGPFLARPYPAPAMLWAAVGTKALATVLVGFGLGLVNPIGWPLIGLVWVYCIAWVFLEDRAKLAVYRHLRHRSRHHQRFLRHVQERLHVSS